MNLDELDRALAVVRDAVGLPDDLPIEGCKEPEYAGGRAKVLRALVADKIVAVEDANLWLRTYYG